MQVSSLIPTSNVLRPCPLTVPEQIEWERKILEAYRKRKNHQFWTKGKDLVDSVGGPLLLFVVPVFAMIGLLLPDRRFARIYGEFWRGRSAVYRICVSPFIGLVTLCPIGWGYLCVRKAITNYKFCDQKWSKNKQELEYKRGQAEARIIALQSKKVQEDVLPVYDVISNKKLAVERNEVSLFRQVPHKVLLQILVHVDINALSAIFRTEKSASLWACCEGFWKEKLRYDFPHVSDYPQKPLAEYKRHFAWFKKLCSSSHFKKFHGRCSFYVLHKGKLGSLWVDDSSRFYSLVLSLVDRRGLLGLVFKKDPRRDWGRFFSSPSLVVMQRIQNQVIQQIIINQQRCTDPISKVYPPSSLESCWRSVQLYAIADYTESTKKADGGKRHLVAYLVYENSQHQIAIFDALSHEEWGKERIERLPIPARSNSKEPCVLLS